jgi:hypothetical protein
MEHAVYACLLAAEQTEQSITQDPKANEVPSAAESALSLTDIVRCLNSGVGGMAYDGQHPYNGPRHIAADIAQVRIPAAAGRLKKFLVGEAREVGQITGPHGGLAKFGNIGLRNIDSWISEGHKAQHQALEEQMMALFDSNDSESLDQDHSPHFEPILLLPAFAALTQSGRSSLLRSIGDSGELGYTGATQTEKLGLQAVTNREAARSLRELAREGSSDAVFQLWNNKCFTDLKKIIKEGAEDDIRWLIATLVGKSNPGKVREILELALKAEKEDRFFKASMRAVEDFAKQGADGYPELLKKYQDVLPLVRKAAQREAAQLAKAEATRLTKEKNARLQQENEKKEQRRVWSRNKHERAKAKKKPAQDNAGDE